MSTIGIGKNPQELIETLVEAITGFSLDELPPASRSSMVQRCTDMFINYIVKEIKGKQGSKAANQIKGIAIYNTSEVFEKNSSLEPVFHEAYEAFITNLK